MRERLFAENGVYSMLAAQIDKEISEAISPIIEKYKGKVDIRDMQLMFLTAAQSLALQWVIEERIDGWLSNQ